MARKTKPAEPHTETVDLAKEQPEADSRFQKCQNYLDSELALLRESSTTDSEEGLNSAVFWWYMYAYIRGIYPGEETGHQRYMVIHKAEETHEAAVRVLMNRAIQFSIDPKPLEKSGRLFRELYKTHPEWFDPWINADQWPECLGGKILELPQDIRETILSGCATVTELDLRLNSKQVLSHLSSQPAMRGRGRPPSAADPEASRIIDKWANWTQSIDGSKTYKACAEILGLTKLGKRLPAKRVELVIGSRNKAIKRRKPPDK